MADFEFDRAAALEKLPRCGSCINCKIIVWSGDAELKSGMGRLTIKPLGPGKTPQLAVNCGWIKHQIEAPDKVQVCDGWRKAGDDLQPRDRR
ncbi:hypothetical protein [Kerstersia gyiorum]|uniref:hypothetical protein n=1 Tax=Kerstersia gyiorum TaxID=206506 RepID=UPI00209F763A|nr:hypothetical protein [Kerstersia gyiorum]MCP1680690.1 hypothetical protein [Kerstersia gyiorum]MCP1825224.1 hypothetical protein [Kerstersia gyiorum]MCP1828647.1 hypothetical protein [Kerstersia gyiorum]MCW2452265.1 hypothetical protein [Kerstersia gyiorum]